jgi:hypothetical protein
MVPETSTTTVDTPTGDDGFGTLLNAVVGAVAATLLSFVPLSPLLGGAIAGYLEGGDTDDGLKVGAIAGAIMLLPFVLIAMAVLVFLGFGVGIGTSSMAFGVIALIVLLLGALYTVGLSVVGGYLGIYVKNEL